MSTFASPLGTPFSGRSSSSSLASGRPVSASPVLSLHELVAFDPRAGGLVIGGVGQGGTGQGNEQRLLCPLCGPAKPKDSAHRSLSLNLATGMWRCYRCNQAGKVREAWEERPVLPRRERTRAALAQTFALPPSTRTTPQATAELVIKNSREIPAPQQLNGEQSKADQSKGWKHALHSIVPLDGTRGMAYLQGRGLSLETAHTAGTRFSSDFMGRPAVVFPLRDQKGVLRGGHGRYVDGKDRPKARTVGDKKRALFVTQGALDPELPALIVTEAPLDALSLAEAGYPAVAVCGTEPPTWFHRVGAFRRVLLAFDADDAGDRAGEKLWPLLESFGARCERLRPEGGKDWSDVLLQGKEALSDWLAWRVFI